MIAQKIISSFESSIAFDYKKRQGSNVERKRYYNFSLQSNNSFTSPFHEW